MKSMLLLVLSCTLFVVSCKKDITTNPPLTITPPAGDTVLPGIIPPGYSVADTSVIDGYVQQYSIKNTDSVVLYINAKKLVRKARLNVYNPSGKIVDYLYLDSIIPQKITTAKPYQDGYGYQYKVTGKFNVKLTSGIYNISNKIHFLVTNPERNAEVLVLFHSNTHQAYNNNGGANLYSTGVTAVSFHRPLKLDKFANEFVKWNDTPYKFDYISDVDMDNYDNLAPYKLLVIVGHSEYWSHEGRANLDRFIAAGKNVLILSGNSVWWQVRYNADKTQMICYKKLVDPVATGVYRTTTFHLLEGQSGVNTIGGNFNYGGYANQADKGWDGFKILAPKNPLFAGTNLAYENIISCKSNELDGAPTRFIAGNPHPVIDTATLGFYKAELLAYDYGFRNNAQTIGTFTALQKTPTSGVVVNVGNTDWCSTNGFAGPNGAIIKHITKNAIYQMYTCHDVFTH
jgi:hypothetical protein